MGHHKTLSFFDIMKTKMLLLVLLFSFFIKSSAQDVTTTFNYPDWIETKQFDQKAALYQVRLTPFFTYVTIIIEPTKNKKRLNYWTSNQTYVLSGNAKLPLLGALGENNTYHSCTYNDGWGWNNVKKGQSLYYTLIFSGRIPEGFTSFSLIDDVTSGRGYSFRNYTIKNPSTHKTWDEGYCRENADNNNDGICGIYEEIGGSKYRLACIKENGNYYLIYLGCGDRITWWFQGDIKAFLEESATLGAFKANWVMQDKTRNSDAYVTFDGKVMKSFLPNGNPSESTYMKMYPTVNTGSSIGGGVKGESEWTGTGFALTNNYVVTNYHVVENAKSIQVQGVNGNFNTQYSATVEATDKYNDLALIKVNGCTISSLGIPYSVKTNTSEVGEEVFVLGYPLTSTMGDEIKLTTGVVSSKTGFQGDVSQYQISAPIQPGNSGGPLFDSKGNVIGIVSAKHRGAENVGYAIKASYLRNLMESAVSANILPQNNKISSLNLSGKVKAVKNFVYYITCTSSSKGMSNYSSSYSSGSSSYGRTYNNPVVNRCTAKNLKVISVSVQDNQTVLTLSDNNRTDKGYYEWFTIDKNAYIVANGQRYTLRRTDGIAISPDKTHFTYAGETKTFTLYFPAIPKSTSSIDFIESAESEWKMYGIQLK